MAIDKNQLRQITKAAYVPRAAEILDSATNNPFQLQKFVLTLTTAKTEQDPFIIGFPFKGILMKAGSDNLTNVNVKFNKNDQGIDMVNMVTNDAINSEHMFSSAYISWPAQSGKTITVYVFVDSSFQSGSLINSGTVTTSLPSTVTGPTQVALSATTATIIIPANAANRVTTLQNKTGADLYVGGSTIGAVGGANEGIKIPADGIIYHSNTAALYGWSVAGGNVSYVVES
jgi:hypothetical protein